MSDADEVLDRLDALERELAALTEHVSGALAGMRAEVARARAGVHELAAAPEPEPEPEACGDVAVAPSADEEGARLVAFDLVTSGTGDDEAILKLSDSFPGVDARRLLAEARAALGA